MKIKQILSLVLVMLMMLSISITVSAAETTLNAGTNNMLQATQNYDLTVINSTYTDVSKVQVDWTVDDIQVDRSVEKVWDPDTLSWVTNEHNQTTNVETATATFNITNLSSLRVKANVSFSTSFSTIPTYTNNNVIVGTVVNNDMSVDTTKEHSATITASITPVASEFATLGATNDSQYGTYTLSLSAVERGYDVTYNPQATYCNNGSWSSMYFYHADGTFDKLVPTSIGNTANGFHLNDNNYFTAIPYTFHDVVKITRVESFITYTTDGTNHYTYEFKDGDFKVTSDMTIIGTGEGQCIDENSLITMADGTTKAMKDIEVGDEVLSIDFDTMTLVARKVIYTSKDEEDYENWNVASYYKYTFSDGTVIKRAMRHRFYSLEAEGYKHLTTWEIGEHAYNLDGTNPTLVSIEVIQENLHYARITLEGSNNYFANGLATGDSECCENAVTLNSLLQYAE